MALGQATFGAGTFNQHLVARRNRRGGGKRALLVGLSLTSMVDMFSLLVIFLLQTFSASPELLAITKGVTLPSAQTGSEIKDAPQLSLALDGVFLDQKRIGATDAILRDPSVLMERLGDLRKVWVNSHPNEAFKGEINLQAHRELPSTTVSQLMGMLPSQHYGSIHLTVVGGGGR